MKYVVETSLSVIIYIPSFIEIASGIEKLTAGIADTQTAC
jgi:hypothetical protein